MEYLDRCTCRARYNMSLFIYIIYQYFIYIVFIGQERYLYNVTSFKQFTLYY
jgi:hypothetical protein